MILIDVTKNDAKVIQSEKLTSGTVGLKCQFNFSKEWDNLSKIAVCVCGTVIRDAIVDESNTIIIPWEVLTTHGKYLDIGVYGTDGNGERAIPTVYATVGAVCKGADPSGEESIEPTPTVWEQVLAFIKNVPYTIDAMGKAIFKGHAWSASADEKGNTIHSHYISADDANNTFSNALKETVTSTGAVRIDNVSPIQHNIEVNTNVTTGFKTYGKNILNYSNNNWEKPSASLLYYYYFDVPCDVTMSMKSNGGSVIVQKSNDNFTTFTNLGTFTLTVNKISIQKEDGYSYRLRANNYTILDYAEKETTIEWIQLELGTEATEYEPYKEPIKGVNAVCPTTTIVADSLGTEITATYNKDINEVFKELKQAIINLGGTM